MVAWRNTPPKKVQETSPDYVETPYPSTGGSGSGPDLRPDLSNVVRPLIKQSQQLPYRGSEYHGVNPNLAGEPPDINSNVFDQGAIVPEKQEPPERGNVPVPVRIVQDDDTYEILNARTTGSVVNAQPMTVVSHMRVRQNLTVLNNGTVIVYISDSPQPVAGNSYAIPAGGTFTSKGKNRFYAVSVDGSTQPISILEEYVISEARKPTW